MADRPGHLQALLVAAIRAAEGMGRARPAKPGAAPLADRVAGGGGIVAMAAGLSPEIARRDAALARLSRALGRIATLQVRRGADLIERGDWQAMVAELQAIAEDAIAAPGGRAVPISAAPRRPSESVRRRW